MKHCRLLLLAPLVGFLGACQVQSGEPLTVSAFAEERMFMEEFGSALPPIGYVGFCRRQPGECIPRSAQTGRVTMNADRWADLNVVNSNINRRVEAATDQEIYNLPEYWALPGDIGDCEDYVLEKRRLLIAQGWPESALLITVVRDEYGEGHAVLSVLTDMGDLVLDNKVDLIRPWSDTPYVYYKRQSREDPNQWVALTPIAQANTALAATRQSPRGGGYQD